MAEVTHATVVRNPDSREGIDELLIDFGKPLSQDHMTIITLLHETPGIQVHSVNCTDAPTLRYWRVGRFTNTVNGASTFTAGEIKAVQLAAQMIANQSH